jgi:hypothetical protein
LILNADVVMKTLVFGESNNWKEKLIEKGFCDFWNRVLRRLSQKHHDRE